MFSFNAWVPIDQQTGKVLALYATIRHGTVARTDVIVPGVTADFDADGQLLGVELLKACSPAALARAARGEPECVRTFLRGAMPAALVAVEKVARVG
jgi:hypothetical protein